MKLKLQHIIKQKKQNGEVFQCELGTPLVAPFWFYSLLSVLTMDNRAKMVEDKVFEVTSGSIYAILTRIEGRAINPDRTTFPPEEFMSKYENTTPRSADSFDLKESLYFALARTEALCRLVDNFPSKGNTSIIFKFYEE